MYSTLTHYRHSFILKSGAFAGVLAILGFAILAGDRPVLIETDDKAVLGVGWRLNHYAPVDQFPTWFALPDRSTTPYANVLGGANSNRLFFNSLLPAGRVEKHFSNLLQANGFQLVTIRPVASSSGLSSLITAVDDNSGRSVNIAIRDNNAVRSIEVSFSASTLVAAKSLSIGS